MFENYQSNDKDTALKTIKELGPEKPIITSDAMFEIAIDVSGSTNSQVGTAHSQTILTAEISLIRRIFGVEDLNVIEWNDVAKRSMLSELKAKGGTSPTSLFGTMIATVKTLLITTDGEIPDYEVQKVAPRVRNSSLENVIAIFVGNRLNSPSRLNLPVFAPFVQNVFGQVLICHWNGEDCRVLIKSCLGEQILPPDEEGEINSFIPSPPLFINEDTRWDDFPIVEPHLLTKLVMNEELSEYVHRRSKDPRLFVDGVYWELGRMSYDLDSALSYNTNEADVKKHIEILAELLPKFVLRCRNENHRNDVRKILQVWFKYADKVARAESVRIANDPDSQKLKQETDYLYDQVVRQGKAELRCKLMEKMKNMYEMDETIRQVSEKMVGYSRLYNSLAADLHESQKKSTDYSLSSLSKSLGSNRANRASKAANNQTSSESWRLDEAPLKECPICGNDAPVALIPSKLSEGQTKANTSDSALNDAFSLGYNSVSVPNETICVFCASYLIGKGAECPFTRNSLATFIPVVKYTEQNFKQLCTNISHWLFGGSRMSIEMQAFVAIVDALQQRRGTFDTKLSEFILKEYVPAIMANFEGILGVSKPLMLASKELFATDYSQNNAESFLKPLRNKNLSSLSCLGRIAIQFAGVDKDNVEAVLHNCLVKIIIMGMQNFCKQKDSIAMMKLLILRDLFQVPYGVPLHNSGKILHSLEESNVLQTVGVDVKEIKKQELLKPNLYSISLLFHTVLQQLGEYRIGYEAFISLIYQDINFKPVILSPQTILEKDVVQTINSYHDAFKFITDEKHLNPVGFSPACIVSSTTLCCGNCGIAFLSPDELFDCRDNKINVKDLADLIKKRRAIHFEKFFGTKDSPTGMVASSSGISNLKRVIARLSWNTESHRLDPLDVKRETFLNILRCLIKDRKGAYLYSERVASGIIKSLIDFNSKLDGSARKDIGVGTNLLDKLSMEFQYLKSNHLLPSEKLDIPSEKYTDLMESNQGPAFNAKESWKSMYNIVLNDDINSPSFNEIIKPLSDRELIYVNGFE